MMVGKTVDLPSNRYVRFKSKYFNLDVYRADNKELRPLYFGIKKQKIPSNLIPTLNFDNYIEGIVIV